MSQSQNAQQDSITQVRFIPGAVAAYSAVAGETIQFDFEVDDVVFDRQANDLIVRHADGSVMVIKDYIVLAESGTPPQVLLSDGVVVAGDVFLFSMVDPREVAADAAESGNGLQPYNGDSGDLASGLDSEGASNFVPENPPTGLIINNEFIESSEFALAQAGGGDTDPTGGDTGSTGGGDTDPTGGASGSTGGGDSGSSGGDSGSGGGDEPVEPPVAAYEYPVIPENDPGIIERGGTGDHYIRASFRNPLPEENVDPTDVDPWKIVGTFTSEEFNGGAGNDFLLGNSGDDTIRGYDGHDLINSSIGEDWIDGGSGNDLLIAGGSNDVVYGGGGYDTISLGTGEDVVVFNQESFGDGSAIVVINDFALENNNAAFERDGVKLEDGVQIEALREVEGSHVEFVLANGTDDNVIVRLMGTTRADFDAQIDSLGDAHAYSDTEQLLQYMAGNESAWV